MTKELEALSNLYRNLDSSLDYYFTSADDDYELIEKSLQALEIIRNKGIILQFIKETYTVEQYNAGVFGTLVKPLTEDEYDLLKEVLG